MSIYAIAVFLHVIAAMGLLAGMAVEWVMVANMRRAETAEQARDWLRLLPAFRFVAGPSMLLLLAAGFYMMAVRWGPAGWLVVALVALFLLPPLGMFSGLRLPKIEQGLATEHGLLSAERRQQLAHPSFLFSIQTRTAIVLGVVFLMTDRPDAVTSAITIAVAVAVGLASALPLMNRARLRPQAI
jgi:hypothetical protein